MSIAHSVCKCAFFMPHIFAYRMPRNKSRTKNRVCNYLRHGLCIKFKLKSFFKFFKRLFEFLHADVDRLTGFQIYSRNL